TWLLGAQEAFRQKRLHALERSAAVLCGDGRFTDALDAGLGAVQSEPLRESAHCRVIEVHLAEGNQAEALRQYDHYRRLLAAELGLRPSPGIRRLVAPLLGRPIDLRAEEEAS
ncbi:MAG TPA: bacterial transcriptional activator domain-containing protein, partial [Nocardioides sp.]|nr:bacterial transcriptional activator domain-containing protein [Nocardioides sp.]